MSFPKDFVWGAATAAYQIEGAAYEDGKSPSVWDMFCKENGTIFEGQTGETACDHYHRMKEDVALMKKLGVKNYRFSISWPRVIPTGFGEVNPKGIEFYNKVIDKLLAHNITPFVDLLHWDLPQCLMEKGGYANPEFPDWYEAFAKVCFESFGDRVKLWSTFNESDIAVARGYGAGTFPPCQTDFENSLVAAQNCFIAHFRAVRLYRSLNLGGKIGAVNCTRAIHPAAMKQEDIEAVQIQYDNTFGMWTEAMLEGTYPKKLVQEIPCVRDNMPEGYQADLDKWFMPMDFVGLNYYSAARTEYDPTKPLLTKAVEPFYAAPGQQYVPYPAGLFDTALYIHQRYHGVDIYITENGCAFPNINDPEVECEDDDRVTYLREHLRMVCRLIKCGVNLKGYMYWNDSDSYEIQDGYRLRFGLTWVNHETGERRWKKSRYYFSEICKSKMVN